MFEAFEIFMSSGQILHGKYEWCYRTGVYILSERAKNSIGVVVLNIPIQPELLWKIDVIDIDFGRWRTHRELKTKNVVCFEANHSPTKILIKYEKKNETVSREYVTLDKMVRNTECSICLEMVKTEENKHIAQCGHVFHSTCLWDYLKGSGLVEETQCDKRFCSHMKTSQPFECPNCRRSCETTLMSL